MDKKEMNHYKHLLTHHKESHEDIIDDMETLSLGDNGAHGSSELSNYDNHPAEIASELFDVEHQMGLKMGQEHEIKQIEHAMKKIKDGTFGLCETCGKEIDSKRLELLPQAKLCIECAKESDRFISAIKSVKKKNRPSEEQVIDPALINDSAKGEQFHDLMEYGSADSHQDRGGILKQ